MTKRVYKFSKAVHAIDTLQNKRLKLTTIDELNDPFDLCAVDMTKGGCAEFREAHVMKFRQQNAVLCFSRNWDNLLMWSHYGDAHKGVCLGFDIPEGTPGANYDTDVRYQPNVLPWPETVDASFIERLLRTKHESWSYEQEVRMFCRLKDPPDESGRNWIGFGPSQPVLKEVIIGVNCDPGLSKIVQEAVKPYGDSVKCWWAQMWANSFLLVREEHPRPWNLPK